MSGIESSSRKRRTTNQRIAFDDDPRADGDFNVNVNINVNVNGDDPPTLTVTTMNAPQESKHWQSLVHEDSDGCIHTLQELTDRFRSDVNSNTNGGASMALWSCLSGYCEALATHKETHSRYAIFPIPFDALKRLAETEFWAKVLIPAEASMEKEKAKAKAAGPVGVYAYGRETDSFPAQHQLRHRARVRTVANAVWDTALNKSQKKDEEHANSLYVCLRGYIDRKSIDCLGSSVATVAGMKLLQRRNETENKIHATNTGNENENDNNQTFVTTSMLALSEDHAYETHSIRTASTTIGSLEGTCEVAIPGSTLRQKSKRACEIADTFRDKKACALLTPETSWLYMAKKPVVCSTVPMSLVPIVANINCNIRSKPPGSSKGSSKGSSLESKQLYRLKRELLWVLYDVGAMKEFPFGILELGDCEGTVGSERGEEWVVSKSPLVEHGEPIMKNEELFLEAIGISRERYDDAQVYPYYYAGHYHKDAGGITIIPPSPSPGINNDNNTINTNTTTNTDAPMNIYTDNEHRFADALQMYYGAARVTCKYRFDTGDCLQLNKHLTSVAALIHEDILTTLGSPCEAETEAESTAVTKISKQPRAWIHSCNARACCFWLLRFLDSLLHWEEWSSAASSEAGVTSKNPHFVEILQVSHKSFVGKGFQTFDREIRNSAMDDLFRGRTPAFDVGGGAGGEGSKSSLAKDAKARPFPVSKRLGIDTTLLVRALRAPKVQIREMDLAILDDDENGDGGGRRSSKRRKRS